MISYISSNIIYNEIEYLIYINIWLIALFTTVLIIFILINSCLININSLIFNDSSLELLITLFSIIFLLLIISPALIIILDCDSILIPSIILYSIGYQWAWQFNLYFSSLFITYIDQRIIPFNLLVTIISTNMNTSTSTSTINTRLLINNESVLLPLYSIIKLFLLSYDVIHSITYYSLGIKIDAIPARINITNSIRPLIKGEYRGYCFELCGQGHSIMILTSIVFIINSWN